MNNLPNPTEPLYNKLQTTDISKWKPEACKRYQEWKVTTSHDCVFNEGEKWMTKPEKKCLICHYNFNEAETTVENADQTENTGFYWSKTKKHCSLDGEYRIFTCSICNFQACHSCRQLSIDKPIDILGLGEPTHTQSDSISIGKKLNGNLEAEDWTKEARKRIKEFKAKDSNHKCNLDIIVDWASEATNTTCSICCFSHFNLFDEDLDDQDFYWTDSGYWDEHEKYNKFYSGTLYICSGCKIRMCSACREVLDTA